MPAKLSWCRCHAYETSLCQEISRSGLHLHSRTSSSERKRHHIECLSAGKWGEGRGERAIVRISGFWMVAVSVSSSFSELIKMRLFFFISLGFNSSFRRKDVKYRLHVKEKFGRGRTHVITENGSTTVRQFRLDVASVTGVPTSKQDWVGWPPYPKINFDMRIEETGIEPVHYFELDRVSDKAMLWWYPP